MHRTPVSPSPYPFPVSTDYDDWWDEECTGDHFYGDNHVCSSSFEYQPFLILFKAPEQVR
jgi:hypothetical protein